MQPEYLAPLSLCDDCELAVDALEAQDLVCVRVLLECFGGGGAHDFYIGAIAHEFDNIVVSDASGISTELSDGPRHTSWVVHLRSIKEVGHGGEAEGPNAAHDLVINDPTALGHEDEVDLVIRVTLDQREAVHDPHVDLGGIGRATRDDNGVLSH